LKRQEATTESSRELGAFDLDEFSRHAAMRSQRALFALVAPYSGGNMKGIVLRP